MDNEDVVGATPTGDAPTTSELSIVILPTKVHLILEVWWYIFKIQTSSLCNDFDRHCQQWSCQICWRRLESTPNQPLISTLSSIKMLNDKMATVSQMTFTNAFSWKVFILIQIALKFVAKGPIDNKSALVQVMAWPRTCKYILVISQKYSTWQALRQSHTLMEWKICTVVVSAQLFLYVWFPLSKPMLTQFTGAYIQHWGEMS